MYSIDRKNDRVNITKKLQKHTTNNRKKMVYLYRAISFNQRIRTSQVCSKGKFQETTEDQRSRIKSKKIKKFSPSVRILYKKI